MYEVIKIAAKMGGILIANLVKIVDFTHYNSESINYIDLELVAIQLFF